MIPKTPFSSVKDTIKGLKRQILGWENVFANYVSEKGLVTRITKKLLKLNIKKIMDKIFEQILQHKGDYICSN